MRAIVIFATLTAVVLARPDVSHLGYNYKQPSGGSSSVGYSSGNKGYNGGNNELDSSNNLNEGVESGDSSSSTFQGISSYDAPYVSGNNYAGNGYTDSASFGSSAVSTGLQYNNGDNFGAGTNGFGSGDNGYSNGASNGFGSGGSSFTSSSSGSSSSGFSDSGINSNGDVNLIQGQSQTVDLTGGSSGGQRVVYKPVIKHGEPIITKNFYVHAAPEEDENVRVEEKIQVVRPQKTYKIIFIKAPSAAPAINAATLQSFPQNEEKTIVYVLSKKDEGITDLGEIPTPPPAVTHKPEVFFIKYKTKQEAANAVANIQAQFQSDSGPTGESSFDVRGEINSNGGLSNQQTVSRVDTLGDVVVESSGSATTDPLPLNGNGALSSEDIRISDGGIDAAPIGLNGFSTISGSGFQGTQSSSQSSFGPSGGQIQLQSSAFGPTGGQTITHSAQIPAGGDPISQTTYSETGNGGQTFTQSSGPSGNGQTFTQSSGPGYTSDSNGASAEFIPQNIIKIESGQQSYRAKYLPPNYKY